MNIKLELLKNSIHDMIDRRLTDIVINADKIADSAAIMALSEIQSILASGLDDFKTVDEIVCVFEKYNLDAGGCHEL